MPLKRNVQYLNTGILQVLWQPYPFPFRPLLCGHPIAANGCPTTAATTMGALPK